ncbi:Hypothetical protein PBC10988_22100 [Planctomycetales bacterium 10988]|nr:Hypothetical protein PBC10988_22100 [Planctomycetales bacterium 10988]
MLTIQLQLRFREHPQREAAAWLLPSPDPQQWIEELLAWQVPLAGSSLLLVPAENRPDQLIAALVLLANGEQAPRVQQALGYGCLSQKLYLPTHAELDPPVSEEELAEQASYDYLLLHPQAGLIGFSAEDRLPLERLFQAPRELPTTWDRAQPGTGWKLPHLVRHPLTVEVEPSQSLQTLMETVGREIAAALPEEIPPELLSDDPNEKSKQIPPSIKKAFQLGIAKLLLGMNNMRPTSPTASPDPAWLVKWMNWAESKTKQGLFSLSPSEERRKELERLMRLLLENPDEGLKYALPLFGGPGRGQAQGGSKLPLRDVRFNLDGMRTAGPADPWDINQQDFQWLTDRYTELANRERTLGRYRRAAYIYSKLLGNHALAAQVLCEGRYFQEAAALYLDELKSPLEAAKCYEKAGLFQEAILLYEKKKEWETAGQLYQRLGEDEQAEQRFELAIKAAIEQEHFMEAARLTETYLHDTERTLNYLKEAWPYTSEARECLQKQLEILARLDRHQEVGRLFDSFADQPLPGLPGELALQVMVKASKDYPLEAIRQKAQDRSRILIGKRFPSANQNDAYELTRLLQTLDPKDQLLNRDAQAFCNQRIETIENSTYPLAKDKKLLSFTLEPDVAWLGGCWHANSWLALGVKDDKTVYLKIIPPYRIPENIKWNSIEGGRISLAADPKLESRIFISGSKIKFPITHLSSNQLSLPSYWAGFVDWIPAEVLVFIFDREGAFWYIEKSNEPELYLVKTHLPFIEGKKGFAPPTERNFVVQITDYLIEVNPENTYKQIHLCAGDNVYLGFASAVSKESILYQFNQKTGKVVNDSFVLPFLIHQLKTSPKYTKPRLLVLGTTDAVIVYGGLKWPEVSILSEDGFDHPCGTFTRGGHIIIAEKNRCTIYKSKKAGKIQFERRINLLPDHTPVDVFPAPDRDQFAVLYAEGILKVYSAI